MALRVLVLGSGGREHALVWKLRQSPRVSEVICAPGNGGIARIAKCVPADLKDVEALVALAAKVEADLTVVGPELPLTLGVVDEFARRGLRAFGPTQKAAALESSKVFAKEFMQRHQIPTAHFAVCKSPAEIKGALGHFHPPVVVKADGLAAGKGVVIAQSKDEAANVAGAMLSGKLLGSAGAQVVLEECLKGEELSFLVVTDGEHIAPLAAAQDHKRIGEGDTGANTGGMGAYSTPELLDSKMQDWLLAHVARPAVAGMKAEGIEYRGVLYCGLMLTPRGPMVLEFNCRFGDPEAQAILMRLESDLLDALEASIDSRIQEIDLRWSPESSVCVVIASGGYPGSFEAGKIISGLEEADALEGVEIFHAATSFQEGSYYTSGGRVLGVTARGRDLNAAVERAYEAANKIHFDGMYYRRDIAARALKGALQ
jgi:phosphoribosylamine--glycine ligase